MASAAHAPQPREGKTAEASEAAMHELMVRKGHSFVERARLDAAEAGRSYCPELGLWAAAELSRALGGADARVVEVRDGLQHVKSGHDVVRRALLLALRDSPDAASTWLHLHMGHPSVLPPYRTHSCRVGSFVLAHVDPWRSWRAAAVFVASLQDSALSSLLALLRWLSAGAGDEAEVTTAVGALRAAFLRHVQASRAACAAAAQALFDERLAEVCDPAYACKRDHSSALRERFLKPAAGDARTWAEVESALLSAPARASSQLTAALELSSFARLVVTRERRAAVAHAAEQRGRKRPKAGAVAAGLFSELPAVACGSAAAAGEEAVLEAFSGWSNISWAAKVYTAYLMSLIGAGLLPATDDGRPTLELGTAFIAAVTLHEVGDDDDSDEEIVGVDLGSARVVGYHPQTSMPKLLYCLRRFFELRGWEVPLEWLGAWRAVVTAQRRGGCDAVVFRTRPAMRRHVREAALMLEVGPDGWWQTGRLEDTPRLDLLQVLVHTSSNVYWGRRHMSVAELVVGDVSYDTWTDTGAAFARVLWARDGNNDGACFAHGGLFVEEAVLKLLHLERAFGNFEHDTLEDVLQCPAKRVVALSLPLFRVLAADGLPLHAAMDSHHLGLSLKILMAMDGRDVTGHAARSGVACDDYVEDVVQIGRNAQPITDRTRRKTGWQSDPGRNNAPVRAYARELQSHGDGVIELFGDDSPDHRAKRRVMLEQLQDSMVPRRGDFDTATALRGAEGFQAASKLLHGANRAGVGVLCRRWAIPCVEVSRAMTADVLRAQVRLRRAVRKHRLPSLALPCAHGALLALAHEDGDAFDEICRLRADLESKQAAALAALPTELPRPCRHLDLQRLKDNTKYNVTHEQLALMTPEELAVLLNDPDVSYECKLARRPSCNA